MEYFDNCTHFLQSIVKTDGKPPVLLYVAVRTFVLLSQKIRSFSQKRRGTLRCTVDKTEMPRYNLIMS